MGMSLHLATVVIFHRYNTSLFEKSNASSHWRRWPRFVDTASRTTVASIATRIPQEKRTMRPRIGVGGHNS